MNTFPRFSALFLVSFASVTLFACAAPTTSGADTTDAPEVTDTAAQPLFACDGTYTRPADDGEGPLTVDVVRESKKVCTVAGYHLGDDHVVTGVIAGKQFRGTWAGDSDAFVVCSDAHCVPWTRSITAGER